MPHSIFLNKWLRHSPHGLCFAPRGIAHPMVCVRLLPDNAALPFSLVEGIERMRIVVEH